MRRVGPVHHGGHRNTRPHFTIHLKSPARFYFLAWSERMPQAALERTRERACPVHMRHCSRPKGGATCDVPRSGSIAPAFKCPLVNGAQDFSAFRVSQGEVSQPIVMLREHFACVLR
jgi:hypothetical protein